MKQKLRENMYYSNHAIQEIAKKIEEIILNELHLFLLS